MSKGSAVRNDWHRQQLMIDVGAYLKKSAGYLRKLIKIAEGLTEPWIATSGKVYEIFDLPDSQNELLEEISLMQGLNDAPEFVLDFARKVEAVVNGKRRDAKKNMGIASSPFRLPSYPVVLRNLKIGVLIFKAVHFDGIRRVKAYESTELQFFGSDKDHKRTVERAAKLWEKNLGDADKSYVDAFLERVEPGLSKCKLDRLIAV